MARGHGRLHAPSGYRWMKTTREGRLPVNKVSAESRASPPNHADRTVRQISATPAQPGEESRDHMRNTEMINDK